jgi:hypothetical protein
MKILWKKSRAAWIRGGPYRAAFNRRTGCDYKVQTCMISTTVTTGLGNGKMKMITKKLLVAFDPKKPNQRSSDFLIVVLEGTQPMFLGLRSGKPVDTGLMVYVGKEIKASDLFAKLVDTGKRIENVELTLRALEHYIQKLQDFRIGNLLGLETDPPSGFKFVKIADMPPIPNKPKIS